MPIIILNINTMNTKPGLSYETAIPVKQMNEEYAWLRINYPGHILKTQLFNQNSLGTFDVMEIYTAKKEEIKVYFHLIND